MKPLTPALAAACVAAVAALSGCSTEAPEPTTRPVAICPTPRTPMNDQQWREKLTPEQYRITRQKGTEAAFTGRYWNTRTHGVYRCVCCGAALFDSTAKFDSGTGWPSFHSPADDDAVATQSDDSLGMRRTEVTCRTCGAHLGHVFDDGPEPTGMRYCINSASLELEPRK